MRAKVYLGLLVLTGILALSCEKDDKPKGNRDKQDPEGHEELEEMLSDTHFLLLSEGLLNRKLYPPNSPRS